MGKVPMPVVIGLLVIAVLVIFFSLRATMSGPSKEQISTEITTDPKVLQEMHNRGMGGRMNTGGMTPQMQGGAPPGNSGNPAGGLGAPGR